jgi:hypothetical protein
MNVFYIYTKLAEADGRVPKWWIRATDKADALVRLRKRWLNPGPGFEDRFHVEDTGVPLFPWASTRCLECVCDGYCFMQSSSDRIVKFNDMMDKAMQDADGLHVAYKVEHQFCGYMLYLNPDGTYTYEDTTGG